ncbi:MAG: caspase family protein [Fibrobacter sp.]|nr:caspase family protein [Fibrobacter sp.]
MKGLFVLILFVAVSSASALSSQTSLVAQPRTDVRINRYVVAISANYGGAGRPMLRYAESDANAFATVLKEMGGVSKQNVIQIKEPSISTLLQNMDNLDKKIAENKSAGRNEVLVYYSGHADDKGLRLGNETYAWKDLRSRIDRLQADVKIAVIDACGSGAITRAKGGVAVPAFMVDKSSDMKGYAFITSSTQDESSQESDKLKGSFFTHSLVSGLRGAGDLSGDGKVTLSEAYQFAFNETLQKTETTMGGAQHPSRDMNLVGTGDVVMTDLHSTNASLVFNEKLEGRIFVRENNALVAELYKSAGRPMELGLSEGNYQVQVNREKLGNVLSMNVKLAKGNHKTLQESDFKVVALDNTVSRGGCDSCTVESSLDSLDHNGNSRVTFNFVDADDNPRKGVQVGLFVTDARKNFIGSQVSLFANVTRKNSTGLQVTTGVNVANNMNGVQLSATGNVAKKIEGAQLSSGINVARRIDGAQVSSGINIAEYAPVQVGVLNIGDTADVQVGIMNVADSNDVAVSLLNINDQSNIQVGLWNIADTVHKTQVGLLNVCAHCDGPVIGLLNFVGNGVWSLSGNIDEMGNTSLNIKVGTAYLYTAIEMGRVLKQDKLFEYEDLYLDGLGFGTQFGKYGSHWGAEYMFIRQDEHIHARFGPGYAGPFIEQHRLRLYRTAKIITGLGITAGLSMNVLAHADFSEKCSVPKFMQKPRGEWHADLKKGHETEFRVWPGFFAGLTVGRF